MKEATTILFIALLAEVLFYGIGRYMGADAQHLVNSPLIEEVELKKSLFYNRKGKDKIRLFYVRVPEDNAEPAGDRKAERKSGGGYWRHPSYPYGQQPLHPTGPPPGAYSPGSPYIQERRGPPYPPSKHKSKYRSKSKPLPSQTKTPCPYKLLAEDLIGKQSRQENDYDDAPPPPPPPPRTTPAPTTTTTPRPAYLPPSLLLPTAAPQLLPQSLIYPPFSSDGGLLLQQQLQAQELLRLQQQQLSPFSLEAVPQTPELYQSSHPQTVNPLGLQYPYLLDSNSGMVLQQQASNPLSVQPPHLVTSLDAMSRSTSPFLLNQPTQHSLNPESLQQYSRTPATTGQQLFYERQPQPAHVTLANTPSFPPQSPQVYLVDNTIKSHSTPTTVLLPNGQLVQSTPQQKHLQSSPTMVLLNAPSEHISSSPLSYLQSSSNYAFNQRDRPISLGQSAVSILSSQGSSYLTPEQSTLLLGGGLGRKIKRIKSPSLLEPSSPVVVLHPEKKSRRPANAPKDQKKYVVISKKELEQIKYKKGNRPLIMNLPPPPDVIHIPFHDSTTPGDSDEYSEYEDADSSNSYNTEGSLGYSGLSSFQTSSLSEPVTMALTPTGQEAGGGGEYSMDSISNILDSGTGTDNEDQVTDE